jgi:head-tail adaptor
MVEKNAMPFGPIVQRRTPSLFSGRLRHKVDIVTVSNVQDSAGGFNLSCDVIYANVWASIEALSGTEKFAAHEFVSQVSHQVVIRYIGAAPSWQPDTNYAAGALVVDANLNLQQAQSDGTSGSFAPVWNQDTGYFTEDGDPSTGLSWKNLGVAPIRTGINSGMQVWFGGRQFQIEAVLNTDERNKMLILLCIEINGSLQQNPNQPGDLS